MRVLIVYAHPEPKSFNGAMTRAATGALTAAGHDVEVHAPARIPAEQRAAHLDRYRERVLQLFSSPTIAYPRLSDYDEQFVLSRNPSQVISRQDEVGERDVRET